MESDVTSHDGVEIFPEGKYPNESMRVLFERSSCRSFSDQKVAPHVLRLVLEAGTHAPSAGNLQPYSIIKIENEDTKRRLAGLCGQGFIGEAPVDLIFSIDLHRIARWASLEVAPFTATCSFDHFWVSLLDTAICAQNICTAADSMGLGSVYVGTVISFFRELRDMLQLPKGVLPVVLLCLGYPKTKVVPRKKLGVDVVVHDERYHELEDRVLLDAFNQKYSGPDSRRVEITEKRLSTIESVCREVHGEEFAKKCLDRIRENGYISSAQRYFGLHYRANEMPKGNEEYLRIIEEFGFDWFREYRRSKHSTT